LAHLGHSVRSQTLQTPAQLLQTISPQVVQTLEHSSQIGLSQRLQ
jgi:hypothetical protein